MGPIDLTDLHVDVFGSGPAAVFIHGSFGWGLDTFPEQRALADRYRVMLVDRRGFGESPGEGELGWPTDMRDVSGLLGELGRAHVVGQSYGAVVALLAAGVRPEQVETLTVIEPPLYEHVAENAAAADVVRALKPMYERASGLTAEQFVSAWTVGQGGSKERAAERMAIFTDKDWAAADASRREVWPGDAPVAFETLAKAAFPKVVVVGAWRPEIAPSRETMGGALRAAAEVVTERIGAELVVFRDSMHNPQLEEPERFNSLLRDLWG